MYAKLAGFVGSLILALASVTGNILLVIVASVLIYLGVRGIACSDELNIAFITIFPFLPCWILMLIRTVCRDMATAVMALISTILFCILLLNTMWLLSRATNTRMFVVAGIVLAIGFVLIAPPILLLGSILLGIAFLKAEPQLVCF